MLDRVLGLASALSFAVGAAVAPAGPASTEVLSFADPAIVESSGLALQDGLFLTVNDSGDTGRVFAVDRSGRTVGVTTWGDATDVEAVAPAGHGEAWVGDLGDNTGSRASVQVLRVPVGRGDRTVSPTSYELVYPGGPRDAETLLVDPTTGRLYVVSKEIFGGASTSLPASSPPTTPTACAGWSTPSPSPPTGPSSPTVGTTSSAATAPPPSTPSRATWRWVASTCPDSRRARGSRSAPTTRST